MKKMRKPASFLLALAMLASLFCFSVAAESPEQVITYYEDGSYSVSTIEIDKIQETRGATSVISAHRTHEYHNSDDELVWSLTVYGTFSYNGSSAEATDADYSYNIYHSDWSFKSGSASYSGATATARATFKHGIFSNSASVSLTCSADGKLS